MSELEIFTEALSIGEATDRAAYLERACGGDVALRQRVERLLALHQGGQPLLAGRPEDLLGLLSGATAGGEGPGPLELVADKLAPFLAPSERPGALGRLGHYDVLEVLGQGGFGVVLKAFDDSLHRVVAIKVLAPHVAATSPPRKRFLREARAAAKVRHENVVQIYEVQEQPIPYLVMEFIPGETLQQRLDRDGPLEPAEVVRLGCQVARGLAAAHEQGLIHRDVKPANILLEAGVEPVARLSDFGLARAGDDASLTQSGVLAGTPMYMSPEQAKGEVLDHRADLFSLGSVLYTMATGRPPFRAPSAYAVLKRVAEDTPRPVREVMAGTPEGLCAVIERLLQKAPGDRFGTAREAAEALGRSLSAPPARPVWPWRWLAGAVAVVLLAVGSWAWWPAPEAEGEGPEAPPLPVAPVVGNRPGPAAPKGLVVTSVLDDGSPGTLRWAVSQANLRHGPDEITFDAKAFAAAKTITLTQGPLSFFDPARTTITGPAAGLTISGGGKARILLVGRRDGTAGAARLVGLTLAGGQADTEFKEEGDNLGGAALVWGRGTLELVGCTVRDNAATGGGGGVFNFGGALTLTNCTFARNKTRDEGGAVKTYLSDARTTAINCTFVGNSASGGGGLFTTGGAQTKVYNSLLARNGGGAITDGAGATTGDHNVMDDGSGGDGMAYGLNNTDPVVGPLGRHGGPTETAPLLTGSPALGAGDVARLPAGTRTDQRGLPRLRKGKLDIGAFQVQ